MNRRQFLSTTAAASMAASVLAVPRAEDGSQSSATAPANSLDRRDSGRDPLDVQKTTLVVCGLDTSDLTERYVRMLRNGGVDCWHKSMGALDSFADFYNFVDGHTDLVAVKTVSAIRQAKRDKKISVILGWQNADLLGERITNPFFGPPRTSLRAYRELGLRILGLAYNLTNVFGGGCMEGHVPLSRAGRLVVEEVHHLNMLLDVGGHTGEQTSLDAIEVSRGRPVICTHCNLAHFADNARNISDKLIDAIAGTGGVIGISAVNDFFVRGARDRNVAHSPRVGVAALADQLDYLKRRVGATHIGLGPDFTEGRALDFNTINQSLAINREIISDGAWLYIKGFEDISKLPNVTRELIQRGWSTREIQDVLGGNWLRVYEAAWGS